MLLPVAIIGIGSGLLDYFTPAMGDDLGKWDDLGLDAYTAPNRSTISFLAAQYFDCNGRILDGLGPAIINLLPRGIAAAIMGLMAGAYFGLLAGAAGLWHRNRVAAADILILIAMITMPWWDYMLLRVCQFNYLWGTVFALATVVLYFKPGLRLSGWRIFGLLVCSFLAGASHEQTGVAMSAVLLPITFYKLLNKDLARNQTVLSIGLSAGTLFSIASPALWQRNAEMTQDAPIGELLVTTLPFTLLLAAICIALSISKNGRFRLKSLIATSWLAYAMIAVIAGLIAIYSTTPGRTGWLSESMALVALARMLLDFRYRLSPLWTSLLCVGALALIAAHFVVAIKWQYKVGKEYDAVVTEYRISSDGIVYIDTTKETEIPVIALGRVKGAPDADDIHLYRVIERAYGEDKRLIILPEAFRSRLECIPDSLSIDGYTVYSNRPDSRCLTNPSGYRLTVSSDGRVITPITLSQQKTIYLASPLIIDPGDHWHSTD